MNHIPVVEAPEDVKYGIALANICKELITKTFPVRSTLNQTGYVHNVHRGRDGPLGFADLRQDLKPLVGHIGRAEIGLYGAERKIGALGLTRAYAVEKSRFSYIRKTYNSTF